jgi:cytochrome c peroxidase
MDYNFSLFFGLAIQLYESTLISDDSPFDRFMDGNSNALTVQQQQGKALFERSCAFCHGGAEFTNASVNNLERLRLRRMAVGSGEAVYDNAFYNIGVLPTLEDLGVGGKDPFGHPLSESRLAQQGLFESLLNATPNDTVGADERIAADGAFKTPGLRNIELTGPYFHNGGQLTLRQVVDFYNRGGDFAENNIDNLDRGMGFNRGLSEEEKTSLVAFLVSLTDDRVRFERAPFDHPQLFITNGHPGDQNAVTDDGTGQATTTVLELPAVGRNGTAVPQPNFLGVPSELSPTTTTPPSSANPLEGSMTEQDCPPGSKLKSVKGGYMCVAK